MTQQEAREIIGTQLLSLWPRMSEAQQQAVRASLSETEQRALDIATGLVSEPEPVIEIKSIDPAWMPLASPAAPTVSIAMDWGKENPEPAAFVRYSDGQAAPWPAQNNKKALDDIKAIYMPAAPGASDDAIDALRYADIAMRHQYRLDSQRDTEEPNRLANYATILAIAAAIAALAIFAWFTLAGHN